MKKSFKKMKRATAFFVVALSVLMTFALAIPCYAATEEIKPDSNGVYPALNTYPEGTVFKIEGYNYSLMTVPEDSWITDNFVEGAVFVGTADEIRVMCPIDCQNVGTNCDHTDESLMPSFEGMVSSSFKNNSTGEFKISIVTPDKPSTLVGEMFKSFGGVVEGVTNGIKGMFNAILWNDGTATSGLSHFAKFGFVMAGLSLALGLGYVIINKIRG